jgi:hypothetical protein
MDTDMELANFFVVAKYPYGAVVPIAWYELFMICHITSSNDSIHLYRPSLMN